MPEACWRRHGSAQQGIAILIIIVGSVPELVERSAGKPLNFWIDDYGFPVKSFRQKRFIHLQHTYGTKTSLISAVRQARELLHSKSQSARRFGAKTCTFFHGSKWSFFGSNMGMTVMTVMTMAIRLRDDILLAKPWEGPLEEEPRVFYVFFSICCFSGRNVAETIYEPIDVGPDWTSWSWVLRSPSNSSALMWSVPWTTKALRDLALGHSGKFEPSTFIPVFSFFFRKKCRACCFEDYSSPPKKRVKKGSWHHILAE